MTDPTTFAKAHDAAHPQLAELALGTLEPGLAAQVDAHLAECAACRAELAELSSAVLALEVDVIAADSSEPLPGAREALVAAARRTPQLAASGVAAGSAARRWRRLPSPSWLAASLASLACVLLTLVVVDGRGRIDSLERRLDDARGDQVPVLKGASIDDLDVGGPFGGTKAQVVLKRDAGIITFSDVPAPPDGMVWQLWIVDSDEQLHELGVIDGARELAILSIDGVDPDDIERLIVTTEPEALDDVPAAEQADAGVVV